MSTRKSNTVRLNTQPRLLEPDEIKRIAEKIAVRVEHDEEETALLLLFFDHLEALAEQRDTYSEMWTALYDFKQHLFLGTSAADNAQRMFQANAYANRGKLLLWPYERKGAK